MFLVHFGTWHTISVGGLLICLQRRLHRSSKYVYISVWRLTIW